MDPEFRRGRRVSTSHPVLTRQEVGEVVLGSENGTSAGGSSSDRLRR